MRAKHLILAVVLSVTALCAHAQSGDYNEEQGEGSMEPALMFEYEGMTFAQTDGGERNVALIRMEEAYLWEAEADPETGERPEEVDWVIPGSIDAAEVNVLGGEIEAGATYTVTAIADCQVVTDYGFIRSVTIPESVTKISGFDFMNPTWGADVYEAINVAEGNPVYKSLNGMLFTADGKELLYTPTFDRETAPLRKELPEGTERIGNGALESIGQSHTVVVPRSLREIGNHAFSSALVGIESYDGFAGLESVGAGALAETRWMEEAGEFPMLGSILVGYKGTERNVTIPDGVKKIGDGALALDYNPNMTSIESVKMPEGLTHIGAEAFASNWDMKEITLPESLKEIGEWAFRGCRNLTVIDIPDGVELIGEGAFAGCYNVESLTIGSGVDSIGDYAFSEMEGVITVEATEPPRCGDNTFGRYTTGYATLVVPAGSEEAYRTARGWKEFESIASGITEQNGLIYALSDDGTAMVKGFTGDEPITDLTIPEKVTYSEKEYTVTEIGVEAFMEMETMRSVTLPGTVEKIGAYAFTMTGISEVALPESLREIGELAFGGTRLRTVEIPAGVEKIGWGALYCEELESVSVAEGNAAYKAVDGVLYTADGLKLMQYPCAKGEKSYAVPEGVEMIMDAAFAGGIMDGKSALEEVTLPQSLKVIGSVAFIYANLREVTIPDGVDSIGEQAFYGCAELEKLTVGKGLRALGFDVFSYDGDDDDVVGGGEDEPQPDPGMMVMRKIMASGTKTATSTGDKLTTVVWNAVRAIGSYDGYNYSCPFSRRGAMTDVTFGEEVEHIPAYLLADQMELKRIRIPASVESIGESAFSYCLGLEEIRVEAVEPPLLLDYPSDVFVGVDKNIPLIVPEGTVEKYREAEGWREFLNCKEAGDVTGSESAEADRPAYYTEGLTLIMDSERDVEVFSTAGTYVYSGRTQTVTLPQAGVYVMRCDGETYKFVVK